MTTPTILVWGIHTRLFHWLLLLAVSLSLTTGLIANPDWMPVHFYSGYTVLGLLIFRLLTGLFAYDYAHFKHFSLSVKSVIEYCKGREEYIGHNPLGAWMVVLMLIILWIQVVSGLLTTDEIFIEGPWVFWAEQAWVSLASSVHVITFRIIMLLIALHVLAISFYQFWRKKNLTLPMITGHKKINQQVSAAQPLTWLRFATLAAIATTITYCLVTLEG